MDEGNAEFLRRIGCEDVSRNDIVQLRAHSTVFRAGQMCRRALILLRGRVRVARTSPAGHEVVLYRVPAGAACAVTTACVLGRQPYPADGCAETDVMAIALPAAEFQLRLIRSESLRDFIFRHHAQQLNSLIGRIESITSERVDVRLARCLLSRAIDSHVTATHGQLAADIGSAREVVSRLLKALERQHCVRLRRNSIELLDAAPLHSLAAGADRTTQRVASRPLSSTDGESNVSVATTPRRSPGRTCTSHS